MGGPDFGGQENLVAPDAGGADALADLAFVLIDLRGIDMAVAELDRLLHEAGAGRPRNSQVPSPMAGILAPLASTNCIMASHGWIGDDETASVALCRAGDRAANRALAAHRVPTRARASDLQARGRQGREHRFRRVRDHREQRPGRAARQPLALLPVADGFDRHAQPGCKFHLGQPRAQPQIANRRQCASASGRPRLATTRGERKFLPVPQFDNPSVRLEPQTLHLQPHRPPMVGDAR